MKTDLNPASHHLHPPQPVEPSVDPLLGLSQTVAAVRPQLRDLGPHGAYLSLEGDESLAGAAYVMREQVQAVEKVLQGGFAHE